MNYSLHIVGLIRFKLKKHTLKVWSYLQTSHGCPVWWYGVPHATQTRRRVTGGDSLGPNTAFARRVLPNESGKLSV